MKKLYVIDLNFTWPPDGGGPADLLNVLRGFSSRYQTTLLLPRITRWGGGLGQIWPLSRTKFFLRGRVENPGNWPFTVETIDCSALEFGPQEVVRRLRRQLQLARPDHLLLADAWYYRPELISGLADYRPAVLFYAHEMSCIKGNGLLFRRGRVCDVPYLDGRAGSYATCLGCAWGFYLGYPSPRWVFEFLRSRAFSRGYQRRCRAALAAPAALVVKNRFIASRLQPYTPLPVRVAPPPVDCRRFQPQPRNEKIKRFLVTGRMEMAVKGLSIAVAAARELWRRRQDFRLLLVSAAATRKLPFVESLSWRPYERAQEIYQQADFTLVPSLWPDPCPMVTLESMACGLPVVGSAVGGIPEQIVEGQSGFLVPPGDAAALAGRMEWLLDHPQQAAEMGRRGRERALAEFDIETVFQRHYSRLFED